MSSYVVDRAFAAAGLDRHVAVEVTDLTTAAEFVREGLGVSMVPRFAVRTDLDLPLATVTGGDLEWPLGVATSALRAPTAAVRALTAMVDDHLR